MKMNKFADWYDKEYQMLLGVRSNNTPVKYVEDTPEDDAFPVDWRYNETIGPVHDHTDRDNLCARDYASVTAEAMTAYAA